MVTRPLALCLFAAFLLAAAPPASAVEKVWGALVFASTVVDPKPAPAEVEPYLTRLQSIFGYNQYQLVALESEKVEAASDREWKLSSRYLDVLIKPLQSDGDGYKLSLTMVREKETLLEMKTRVAIDSPLLIRGPLCGRGQLIFLLEVR